MEGVFGDHPGRRLAVGVQRIKLESGIGDDFNGVVEPFPVINASGGLEGAPGEFGDPNYGQPGFFHHRNVSWPALAGPVLWKVISRQS